MESTEDVPMTNGYSNGVDATAAAPTPGTNGVSGNATPDVKKHSSSSGHHSSSSSKDKHKHSSSSSKYESEDDEDSDDSGSCTGQEDYSTDDDLPLMTIKSEDKHHHSSSSRDKDKHHSSSSSKHHGSSSSSSKHKDGSSSSSKHHSSSSKHSSSSSSKHGSSSSGHKHSSSSSSSKDKHHSSSSSSKDKHSSSSSSSKHRDGHHSSSSKHSSSSHKSSSKDKDRHREKDKERHKEHRDKPKEEVRVKDEPPATPVKESAPSAPVPAVFSETVKMEEASPERPAPPAYTYDSPVDASPVKRAAPESDSEDDTPLIQRSTKVKVEKRPMPESDDDDEPLISRMKKVKKEETPSKKRKSDDDDFSPAKKKKKKDKGKGKDAKEEKKGGRKKSGGEVKEEPEKWKWWEEDRKDDGTKWRFLEHKGPVFAPPYEPLPDSVGFYYDGKRMKLKPETEEVMTFYGRMIDHDYTTMDVFNTNFMKDWRKVMSSHEREIIKDIKKCNFHEVNDFFKAQSEARKNKTKEQKQALKEENAAMIEEYGFCIMDGHKEKVANFRIEPPGLFRGRGEHPKMGMLKTRTLPEDIIINCSKESKIPPPPKGHRWREVRHDNTVSWLCSWNENVQGQNKYIMLNAASKLKGEKDWMKYEKARNLHRCVDKIRANYREDWKSKEMRIRQRAVALYFIDKLALRAGNEKEEGETADTVGCCSLRVEHIKLNEEMDGKEFVVEFDFLGKDSIRYYNAVAVEKRVFKNLQLFTSNKKPTDDLFDRLNTAIMNKHLQTLMDGLTAKVFRTYNASKTLQEQLDLLTNADDPIPAKILSYNRANRAVALLCNHQRAAPKNFDKQKENLQNKVSDKMAAVKKAKKDLKAAKADFKASKSVSAKGIVDKKKKTLERLEEQLTKLEVNLTDKEENKEIALGTSKLNYLDPRISVAWCKKWDVPIEKVYNKTQRDKFTWAIEMVDEDFTF